MAERRHVQLMRKVGFEADLLSVDRDDVSYVMLRTALRENRVHCYPYQPLEDELVRLQHDQDKKKVNHPRGGSKDTSDTLAGCVYNCMTRDKLTGRVSGKGNKILISAPHVDIGDIEESPEQVLRDFTGQVAKR